MQFILSFEDFGPEAARLDTLPALVAAHAAMAGTVVRTLPIGAAMGAGKRQPRFGVTMRDVKDTAEAFKNVAEAIVLSLGLLFAVENRPQPPVPAPHSCEVEVLSGSTSVKVVVPCSDDQNAMRQKLEEALSKIAQLPEHVSVRPIRR